MKNASLISGIACKEIADFSRGLLDEGLIFFLFGSSLFLFIFFFFRIEILAVTNYNLSFLSRYFILSDRYSRF